MGLLSTALALLAVPLMKRSEEAEPSEPDLEIAALKEELRVVSEERDTAHVLLLQVRHERDAWQGLALSYRDRWYVSAAYPATVVTNSLLASQWTNQMAQAQSQRQAHCDCSPPGRSALLVRGE